MNKTEEFSSCESSGDSDVDYSGEEIRECKLYRIKVENSSTGTIKISFSKFNSS